MKALSSIQYNNKFTQHFDGDDVVNLTPRQTPGVLYSAALPTPVKQVSLLAWNEALAEEMEIEKPTDQQDIDLLGGNYIAPSMKPYAACYAGHQFGNWAGQLGDGRAITLGEITTSTKQTYELQLKGPGPTAYSRRADGRAVLRSSVREYLMSEAMHYLGVPTTRALSLVSTGDKVMRDMFYDGNAAFEPGAIVARVAPSFLRFGNFEILAARGEIDHLKQLAAWTIDNYYPHISGENKILDWYKEIVERTATLMIEWLRVGFVHGVMNTDNMSILGLTIDYGPYAFVDQYDDNFTPNTTDLPGRRYAFGKQATIAKWNLGCLGGAIAPLLPDTEALIKILDGYDTYFATRYYRMLANKLGFEELVEKDIVLINEVQKMLNTIQPDMTMFYQFLINLPEASLSEPQVLEYFSDTFYKQPTANHAKEMHQVIEKYQQRFKLNKNVEVAKDLMRKNNPRFILRNYLLHQAIETLEKGDSTLFNELQQAMTEPYSNKFDRFFTKRPDWASQKAGCSMLSCSS